MYFKYISVSLLPIFLLKLLVVPSNISDALVIIALACVYAFSYFLEEKKEVPINEQLKAQLAVSQQEIKEIKSTLTAFKLSNQMKLK